MAYKTGYTLFNVDFSKGQATNFNQFVACIHPPLSSNKIGVPLLDFVFGEGMAIYRLPFGGAHTTLDRA